MSNFIPDANDFANLVQVINSEELYRLRHRLQKIGNTRLVGILTDEIQQRDVLEKEEHKKHYASRHPAI